MTTAEVILLGVLCHFVGDYITQSHWMAKEKTQRWWPAIAHAATYTLPFLLLTQNPVALLVIGGTHAVIDRYRLARHLVWLKNQLAPRSARSSWAESSGTGYPNTEPVWLTVWLMVAADNTVHVGINTATLWWLR
jgi:hypothetical protein